MPGSNDYPPSVIAPGVFSDLGIPHGFEELQDHDEPEANFWRQANQATVSHFIAQTYFQRNLIGRVKTRSSDTGARYPARSAHIDVDEANTKKGESTMSDKDYVTGREMDAHLKSIETKIDSNYKQLEGKLDSFLKEFSDKESRLFDEVKQSAARLEQNNRDTVARVDANNRSTKNTVITTVIGAVAALASIFVIYSGDFDNQIKALDEKSAYQIESVKRDVSDLKADVGVLNSGLQDVRRSQGEMRDSLQSIAGSLREITGNKPSAPDTSSSANNAAAGDQSD
ncbi:hypothetical protein [Marinobacter salsuginis]|uniref:hypothetical protein n=1 Tax=Marinobacter salsuginis TaxID=418719 RepID=UPI001AE063D0|nr:hypothetical protein [Marinobacter salsuginis]QTN41698.1 hypothetical protein HZ997_19065 [Marinobacter salsuginis]